MSPDLYIYFDEFAKDDTFLLCAVLVPADIASALLADWDALRREIKTELLTNYPRAAAHPSLQGNRLPEIHTVDLFQSAGYYRKYLHAQEPDEDRDYYLKHYQWLEDGLKIITRHNIEFICFGGDSEFGDLFDAVKLQLIERFQSIADAPEYRGRRVYSRKKLLSLLNNKYLFLLPVALFRLEAYLKTKGHYAEVVCDDNEMSKGFSVTDSVDYLREGQHLLHLSRPRFTSGLDETLLQVPDLLGYVMGQSFHAVARNAQPKPPLDSWFEQYVSTCLMNTPAEMFATPWQHASYVIEDLLAELCFFDPEAKRLFKAVLKKGHSKSVNAD